MPCEDLVQQAHMHAVLMAAASKHSQQQQQQQRLDARHIPLSPPSISGSVVSSSRVRPVVKGGAATEEGATPSRKKKPRPPGANTSSGPPRRGGPSQGRHPPAIREGGEDEVEPSASSRSLPAANNSQAHPGGGGGSKLTPLVAPPVAEPGHGSVKVRPLKPPGLARVSEPSVWRKKQAVHPAMPTSSTVIAASGTAIYSTGTEGAGSGGGSRQKPSVGPKVQSRRSSGSVRPSMTGGGGVGDLGDVRQLDAATAFAAAALVRGASGSYPVPPASPSAASVASSVPSGFRGGARGLPGSGWEGSAHNGSVHSGRPNLGAVYNSSDSEDGYGGGYDDDDDDGLAYSAAQLPPDSMDWSELSSSLPPSNFGSSLTPSCSNWGGGGGADAMPGGGGSRPASRGPTAGLHQHLYPGCSQLLPPGGRPLPPGLANQLPASKFGAGAPLSGSSSNRPSHEGGGSFASASKAAERLLLAAGGGAHSVGGASGGSGRRQSGEGGERPSGSDRSAFSRPPQLSAILERGTSPGGPDGTWTECSTPMDPLCPGQETDGRSSPGPMAGHDYEMGGDRDPRGRRRSGGFSRLSHSSLQLPGGVSRGFADEGSEAGPTEAHGGSRSGGGALKSFDDECLQDLPGSAPHAGGSALSSHLCSARPVALEA